MITIRLEKIGTFPYTVICTYADNSREPYQMRSLQNVENFIQKRKLWTGFIK